jgi:hypothetical protein
MTIQPSKPPFYIDTTARPFVEKLRTAVAHFQFRFGIPPKFVYLNHVDAARFEDGKLDDIPVFGTAMVVEGSFHLFAQPVEGNGGAK